MSQAKVDRYKEEKKNRAQIMKREKRNAKLRSLAGVLVLALVVVWAAGSVVGIFTQKPEETVATEETVPVTYTVNTDALDAFMQGLE